MTYLNAVVLGSVQALGEFLPISSSAHLVLVPRLLGWVYQGKVVDVALHWGTLVAVCAYFWNDWIALIKAGFSREKSQERSLFWYIMLATLPGGLTGLLLEKRIEDIPTIAIAGILAGFAILLWASDRYGRHSKGLADLGLGSTLAIGAAQALAVIPGVSRSGITLTAALWLGLKREDAARFSFLLSVPIVVAAGLHEARHLHGTALTGPFWLSLLVTTIVGWAAIRFLLSYLKTRGVGLFVVYRILFALFCGLWAWR